MKLITPLLVLTSIAVLNGCTRIYYTPTTQNVPLLTKKNDVNVNFSISYVDEYSAMNFQAAYSPIQHLGIMVNTVWGKTDGDKYFTDSEPNTGHLTEGGIGGYLPLKNDFTAEVYAGFGKGALNYAWSLDTIAPVTFNRTFVQFAIGYKIKYFEWAFSNRFSFVNYTNNDFLQTIPSYESYYDTPGNNLYLFMEPAITIRGGMPYAKIQIQYQKSFLTNNHLPRSDHDFSVGLLITPGEFFKPGDTKMLTD